MIFSCTVDPVLPFAVYSVCTQVYIICSSHAYKPCPYLNPRFSVLGEGGRVIELRKQERKNNEMRGEEGGYGK